MLGMIIVMKDKDLKRIRYKNQYYDLNIGSADKNMVQYAPL